MTPEQIARRNRLAKRARHMAAMGKPVYVLPEEFARGMRILRKAQASGMSLTQIADQLETAKSTPQKLLSGQTVTMRRETYDKLLRLQPELPERTGDTRRGGAKMDPRATVRRLQALVAMGWTSKGMSPYIGMDQRNLSNLVLGKCKFVYAVTQREIHAAYDKLQHMDPAGNGETVIGIARAKSRARSHSWAPPWAWDEDTIDDPAAQPEWTGACGTEEGYRIHVRETFFGGVYMPPCDACRAVAEVGDPGERKRYPLKRENLAAAIKASPLTGLQIGEGIYGPGEGHRGRDVLYRWRDGSRQPRRMSLVEKMAAVLDVDTDYLLDRDEIAEQDAAPRYKPGDFNPFVLRAAFDLDGMSYCRAEKLPGCTVSKAAINSWVSGTSSPQQREKVRFLAEHYNVDISVFYF